MLITAAGSSAAMTLQIIWRVVSTSLICGLEETTSLLLSIMTAILYPYSVFCRKRKI
jgi:hypothetical protein